MCRRSRWRFFPWISIVLACAGLVLSTGCAWRSQPDLTIHESARGAVYLERVEHKTFHAAHPIKLDPNLIARVLRGVHVRGETAAIGAAGPSLLENARLFSDEDIAFLAPLISTAFSRAATDQQIKFRIVPAGLPADSAKAGAAVTPPESSPSSALKEATEGTIYAYGLSLHLTLSEYRHRPKTPETVAGPERYYPVASSLTQRELRFLPEIASRPETYREPGFSEGSPVLVVDYELLAKLPDQPPAVETPAASPPPSSALPSLPKFSEPPAVMPIIPPATQALSTELQSVKESLAQKDVEIEELKKELEEIKRQLAEQQGKKHSGKRKSKQPPKTRESTP